MLGAFPSASPLDKDSPHGLGRGYEEVAFTLPLLVGTQQAKIGLVNQLSRLKRLPWHFPCELPAGQPAQLSVQDPHKLVGRPLVSVLDPLNELRDFGHWSEQRLKNSLFLPRGTPAVHLSHFWYRTSNVCTRNFR
jgi:hypothetical protein